MAFPWPGKKDMIPGSKPEFPSALEVGGAEESGSEPSAASAPKAAAGSAKDADELLVLTQRLEHLGGLLDEAKEQVTSYLIHRESQSTGADPARSIAWRFDALAEKLDQVSGGGGRGVDQKLDAIYGKLDQLTASASRPGAPAGEGGSPAVSEGALKSAVRPVLEKLEQVEAKFKAVDALKEAFVPSLAKVRDALSEQHGALGTGLRQLSEVVPQYFNALPQYFTAIQQQVAAAQQHADAGLRTIIDILRPPETEASGSVGGDWQAALLGAELAGNSTIARDRQELLGAVLQGDSAAGCLVGSIVMFRSSPPEKMPPWLKEIGEAFYRWQPRTSNRPGDLEKALVDWLQRACEQSGMANSIELVHPGERFDSTRHNASKPGVEITQVLGWIVLRDNGKVYTKAAVAVK